MTLLRTFGGSRASLNSRVHLSASLAVVLQGIRVCKWEVRQYDLGLFLGPIYKVSDTRL